MIEKLFKELERLKYNDLIYYVSYEDWKYKDCTPYFYIGRTYYELHSDGVLRYWYSHMKEEGLEANIEHVLEDLSRIKAESITTVIEVVEGSLIVSPLLSKEDNIKMFEEWIKETYK